MEQFFLLLKASFRNIFWYLLSFHWTYTLIYCVSDFTLVQMYNTPCYRFFWEKKRIFQCLCFVIKKVCFLWKNEHSWNAISHYYLFQNFIFYLSSFVVWLENLGILCFVIFWDTITPLYDMPLVGLRAQFMALRLESTCSSSVTADTL